MGRRDKFEETNDMSLQKNDEPASIIYHLTDAFDAMEAGDKIFIHEGHYTNLIGNDQPDPETYEFTKSIQIEGIGKSVLDSFMSENDYYVDRAQLHCMRNDTISIKNIQCCTHVTFHVYTNGMLYADNCSFAGESGISVVNGSLDCFDCRFTGKSESEIGFGINLYTPKVDSVFNVVKCSFDNCAGVNDVRC